MPAPKLLKPFLWIWPPTQYIDNLAVDVGAYSLDSEVGLIDSTLCAGKRK